MRLVTGMIAVAALLSPAMAAAQVVGAAAALPSERRLSPEQVEAVLAEAAAKHKAAEKQVAVESMVDKDAEVLAGPPVHGEVGFSVGTGGYRELFGTGIYPVGEDGVAAISLDFVDWGHRRVRR